jgi:hypothetical protein
MSRLPDILEPVPRSRPTHTLERRKKGIRDKTKIDKAILVFRRLAAAATTTTYR